MATTPFSRRRAAGAPLDIGEISGGAPHQPRRPAGTARRRHNHCFTSPVFREKVRIINTKLAERYKGHKALAGWHISNEYKRLLPLRLLPRRVPQLAEGRYTTLDALNRAWYTAFWSQTIQSWIRSCRSRARSTP